MLNALKRWFSKEPADADWRPAAAWARRRSLDFKRARDDTGFVIEGRLENRPWRLEWGPPQRAYISGRELRLRMELGLPTSLQMLLLSRGLMERLERETFERYTESMQTRVDDSMPEEMRWLAMYAKVNLATIKSLRTHFGAVAAAPAPALGWLEGPLADQLVGAQQDLLAGDPPFVLMSLRGRLYLRMQLDEADPQCLDAVLKLYEVAAKQALRVASGEPHEPEPPAWPTTASTAWQSQFIPDEPPERRGR